MPTDATTVELLKVAEAAEMLRISVPTLRRIQQARKIRFIKVGGCVRFSKTDIIAYLNQRGVDPIGQ